MSDQYISVSGLGSYQERLELIDHLDEDPINPLFIGIQSSTKTQIDKLENRLGQHWHPVGDSIWEAFGHTEYKRLGTVAFSEGDLGAELARYQRATRLTRSILHFAVSSKRNSSAQIATQLQNILSREPTLRIIPAEDEKPYVLPIEGIQLNGLDWTNNYQPALVTLKYMLMKRALASKTNRRGFKIIAQIGKQTLETADPSQLAQSVSHAGASFALLDVSGGTGESFAATDYAKFIESVQKTNVQPAVAGGLGPQALDNFAWLVERFGPLSLDAEAKLRDNYNPDNPKDSTFSAQKAAEYITEAQTILQANQP